MKKKKRKKNTHNRSTTMKFNHKPIFLSSRKIELKKKKKCSDLYADLLRVS